MGMYENYRNDWAAVSGKTVTESHAGACIEFGHAARTFDGVRDIHCPRCGNEAWKFCAGCRGPIDAGEPFDVCEYCASVGDNGSERHVMAPSDTPDENGNAYDVPVCDSTWEPDTAHGGHHLVVTKRDGRVIRRADFDTYAAYLEAIRITESDAPTVDEGNWELASTARLYAEYSQSSGEVKQTYPEGTGSISFRGIEQADSETVERDVRVWKLDGSRFISARVAHRITADFISACFLPDMPDLLSGYPVNAGWFLEVTLKGYADLVKWAERFDSVGNAQTLRLVALAAWIAHNSLGN